VLTTTDDAALPQHAIDLDWSPDDKPADSIFDFTPPPGTRRLP
jgi:hypothetical protein